MRCSWDFWEGVLAGLFGIGAGMIIGLSIPHAEAGKIVGESLEDDARSQRVVDRFLADLDRHQSAGVAE